MMNEIIQFPDVLTEIEKQGKNVQDLYAPDGTPLLLGNHLIAETPLVANRKKWRLYPNIDLYKETDEAVIYRRLSDGALIRMTDNAAINLVGLVRNNPGIKVEDAIATVLNWIEEDTGPFEDEQEFEAELLILYRMLAWAIALDMLHIEK